MIQKEVCNLISITWLARVCILSLLLVAPSQASEVAARVQFVVGKVLAISENRDQRPLNKGDEVFTGDTLESGPNSAAQLLFSDDSRIALRSNTILRVEDYHYDRNNGDASNSVIALLQGAVRSITGLIGKFNKRNVQLVTPVATIGIRGTDHETVHVTPDFNNGDSAALAGTYNKVYSGGTILQSDKGTLLLDANQVGFVAGSPGNADEPVLIDALPKEIDELLVKKLPLQQDVDWARTIDGDSILQGALANETNLPGLSGETAEELASRLNQTTSSLLNSLDTRLSGDLGDALDGGLPASTGSLPTSSRIGGSLSGGAVTPSLSGTGGGTSLPLSGSSLNSITLPVKPLNLTLPAL